MPKKTTLIYDISHGVIYHKLMLIDKHVYQSMYKSTIHHL